MLADPGSVLYQMIFMVLNKLKNLKKLKVASISAAKKTNIEILNSTFGKDCPIEDLEVNFVHEPDQKSSMTDIKFPKYLKKLKSLKINGVWHKDFTETLFDMAS